MLLATCILDNVCHVISHAWADIGTGKSASYVIKLLSAWFKSQGISQRAEHPLDEAPLIVHPIFSKLSFRLLELPNLLCAVPHL